jgi:formate hydrogenlyase transcriptional activator
MLITTKVQGRRNASRTILRELQNLIERAVILSNGGVLPNPLPASASHAVTITSGVAAAPATTLKDSERTLILRTLQGVGWVIGGPKGAATKLGLKRTTLIHKMQKLGITRPVLPSAISSTARDVLEPPSQF